MLMNSVIVIASDQAKRWERSNPKIVMAKALRMTKMINQ